MYTYTPEWVGFSSAAQNGINLNLSGWVEKQSLFLVSPVSLLRFPSHGLHRKRRKRESCGKGGRGERTSMVGFPRDVHHDPLLMWLA